MIRLCIDTSIGTSIAVTDDDVVLSEAEEFSTLRHAEVIGDLIANALSRAEVSPPDVDEVVGGVGPGPFTGLRVGLAAATAFAIGANAHLRAVVSHDAIAAALCDDLMSDEVEFVVTTDARRKEIAWSRYSLLDLDAHPAGRMVRVEGPALSPADAAIFPTLARVDAEAVSAKWLGLIASVAADTNREGPAFEPLYLRSPDVTIASGIKRVSSS